MPSASHSGRTNAKARANSPHSTLRNANHKATKLTPPPSQIRSRLFVREEKAICDDPKDFQGAGADL